MSRYTIVLMAGLLLLAIGCSQSPGRPAVPTASTPSENVEEIVMEVGGMSCDGCASRIEGKLSGAQGVLKCNVDFSKKEAQVAIDPDQQSSSDIISAIQNLGFSAKEKN